MRRATTARKPRSATRTRNTRCSCARSRRSAAFYGVQERQFRRYFRNAQRVQGHDGCDTAVTLERRLDNVIYRLGFADLAAQARQLVRHGHFTLNGHNHDVPSYLVKVGDLFGVRPGSRGNTYFQDALQRMDPPVCRPGWSGIRTAWRAAWWRCPTVSRWTFR